MKIDDTIIQKYINDNDISSYCDYWVFYSIQKGKHLFEKPALSEKKWVNMLRDKLISDAKILIPYNARIIENILPDFQNIAKSFSLLLIVGCPEPYDAMVLQHDGQEHVVFDLLRFSTYVNHQLEKGITYDFRRILTHELSHVCIQKNYPRPKNPSYIDNLNYTAFNEGFAHALAYQEDMTQHSFDSDLQSKFDKSKAQLQLAVRETDPVKQAEYIIASDSGAYWGKFASIAGKLYLLKNKENFSNIYNDGWRGFTDKILQ